MADNTTLNTASGGDTIATDDIGGVKYQRVKPALGADGTATDAVPVSNGMDVTGAAVQAVGLVAQFDDASVGTVTENQFAPVRISSRRALLVEGVASGTVIPVSDGSGSLTVDNGGTFVVQENGAALTALQLLDDVVVADDAAFTPGTTKVLMVGATLDDTTPDTVNEGDGGALRMTSDRALHSSIRDSAGNNRGANVTASNQLEVSVTAPLPTGANTIGAVNPGTAANWGVYVEDAAETAGGNLLMAGSVRRDTAASSAGTTGDNATINTDAAGRLWTSGAVVEDAGHTTGDQLVAVATRRIDTAASSAGTSADYATLDSSAEGAVWATLTPTTTSGCSTFMASGSDGSSILVATAQAAKASAGTLYGYYAYNPEAAVTFVHFYNTASGSVTVGTTNPLFTLPVPAGSAANLALPYGIAFSTAITVAATTTAGGNTAPATGVSLVLFYK